MISDKVKFDDSVTGYRKVVAAQAIKSNQFVLIEPYVLVAVNETFVGKCCHLCLIELDSPKRCSACKFAHYCSQEHQLLDWKAGHKKECALMPKFYQISNPTIDRMTLVMLKIYVQIDMIKDGRFTNIFDRLKHNEDDKSMKMSMYRQVARSFMTTAGISEPSSKIDQYAIYLDKFVTNAGNAPSTKSLGIHMAATLGDKASWFNHSCQPNCLCVGEAGKGKVIATIGDVAAGDELTYAYVDLLQHVDARKSMLMALYKFECKCAKCEREENEQKVRRDVDIGKIGIYRDLSSKSKIVDYLRDMEKSIPPYDYAWVKVKGLVEAALYELGEAELHHDFSSKFTDKYQHWFGKNYMPLTLVKHYLQLSNTAHYLKKYKEAFKYVNLCLPVYERGNDHESLHILRVILQDCIDHGCK